MSVVQLNNTDHKLEFQNRKENIYDNDGNFIGTREQTRGNLLYLDPTINTCLFYRIEDVFLWHKRLCHINFKNIVKVSRRKRVRVLPSLHKSNNTG